MQPDNTLLKNDSSKKIVYLLFTDRISASSAQAFGQCISTLPEDTDSVYILFATDGGVVTYGFALYHLIRALPYEVVIHNIGSVDSIGLAIFLAGSKRYTSSNGTFLIHHVTADGTKGKLTASALKETLQSLQTNERKARTLYKSHFSISDEEIDRLFESGELKDAAYALDRGIVHDIREIQIPPGATFLVVNANAAENETDKK